MAANPDTRAMLSGVSLDHLKSAQGRHWTSLFAGTFDEAQLDRTVAIGTTHQRIGLEPRWYIGGYALAMTELMTAAVDRYRWQPAKLKSVLRAIVQTVCLDMDLAISCYIKSGDENRQKELWELAILLSGKFIRRQPCRRKWRPCRRRHPPDFRGDRPRRRQRRRRRVRRRRSDRQLRDGRRRR